MLSMLFYCSKDSTKVVTPPTVKVSLPIVTTTSASTVTATGAILGGNVTSDGNATITERGVVYATTQNPTTSNTKVAVGTGTGSFTTNVTGVTAGTTYYVRAYAINSQGTAYGSQETFSTTITLSLATITTTAASTITSTGATLGGNVTGDGNATVSECGVVFATTQNPTTSNTKVAIGTGTGSFTSNITGLTAGTTYFVRAYATNSQGTAYGSQVTFTTSLTLSLATVSTTVASNITFFGATLGGNVTNDGNATVIERGVVYATTQNPTTVNIRISIGTGTGSFTSNIAGLTGGTTYYVRAYAVNSQGTAYGSQESFTTNISTPTVTTASASNITSSGATLGGNVTNDGSAAVIERGIVYATTENPTTANTRISIGNGTGSFSSNIAGLIAVKTYYFRAYAINNQGTSYGGNLSFTTAPSSDGTITDTDGNTYATVNIGSQVWMASNLKTTKFNNGLNIPNVTDNTAWNNLTNSGYCWYNNDNANKNTYGALYNWYTVGIGDLCPQGWHVPTRDEWTILTDYLGGAEVAGGKLKEAGTSHWLSPNLGANNASGFSGLPGGCRQGTQPFDGFTAGTFSLFGQAALWWCSTKIMSPSALFYGVVYNYGQFGDGDTYSSAGFSVRCIKN
jgi:uncharacterized protein (TIGR02145 family)